MSDGKIKNVIIVEHEPLTPRLREAWMIDELINRGIQIQYWDLSNFIDKNLQYPNKETADFIVCMNSFEEFETRLSSLIISDYIFFVEVQEGWRNLKIFKELKKQKCHCVKYDLYASVAYPQKNVWLKRLKLLFTRVGLKYKSFLMYNKVTKFFNYTDTFSPCSYRSRTISVNHPDYEKFKKCEPFHNGGYLVFLDIYYPLHPDYIMYVGKEKDPHTYWKAMNRVFDMFEKKFGKEVIIAAHPKSDYDNNTFAGRKIIKNMTCELVKGCEGVILHDSASINFAILSNKPLFIGFIKEQMEDETTRQSSEAVSRFIDTQIHILDNISESDINFKQVSEDYRNRFIFNMLSSEESKDRWNIDIFYDYIINQCNIK